MALSITHKKVATYPDQPDVEINKAEWNDTHAITGTIEISDVNNLQTTLDAKADLVGGKVPSSQLPSYVDDVIEVSTYSALPNPGETGKIYITDDTNKTYRWTGSTYIEVSPSSVESVFGRQGIVTAQNGDYNTAQVTENTNLYYTDTRARNALSLTTTGTSGAAAYNSGTGALNIPQYQPAGNYPTGTGVANRVAYWTSTTSLSNSANLTFDGTKFYTTLIDIPATSSTQGQITQAGARILHTYGAVNTFLGKNAFNFTSTGDQSVGVGEGVLANSVSGRGNVGVGPYVMNASTTGAFNTGIGWYALANNQTGSNNVAVGSGALIALTGGDYNIAIGGGALQAFTSGSYSLGIGAFALYSNTGGANNLAIGTNTQYAGLGSGNTAVGQMALVYTQNGNDNTAFGYGAANGAAGNANVDRVTAIGSQAGSFLQTGASDNTLLGYKAGNNLTAGSNNIVLGSNVSAPAATSANTVNIGNLLYGTGAASGNTPASGNIGIGVVAPSQKLHVAGNIRATALVAGLTKTDANGVFSNATAGTDYQAPITLTTSGSGAATFIGNTLNIPTPTGVTSYSETPSGTINGTNTAFTLANSPASANAVIVLLDGVVQYNGIDYTVSGSTVTFTSAPATGSSIFAYYNIASGGVGLPYIDVTSNMTMMPNVIYYTNSSSLITLTLPATFNQNDIFQIIGKGAGGWKIAQQAGQTIRLTSTSTTTGTGGSIASTNRYDNLVIRGLIPNTDLTATARNGSYTVV